MVSCLVLVLVRPDQVWELLVMCCLNIAYIHIYMTVSLLNMTWTYAVLFTGYKLAFNYMKAKRFVDAIDICHHVSSLFVSHNLVKIYACVIWSALGSVQPMLLGTVNVIFAVSNLEWWLCQVNFTSSCMRLPWLYFKVTAQWNGWNWKWYILISAYLYIDKFRLFVNVWYIC